MAAALVLIEVPGRVVGKYSSEGTIFEHGWPWPFLRRQFPILEVPFAGGSNRPEPMTSGNSDPVSRHAERPNWNLPWGGIPWLVGRNWRFWETSADGFRFGNTEHQGDRYVFRGELLALDLAAVVAIWLAIVFAWEFRRRRRRGLFSVRLSDVLVVTTAFSFLLGWLVHLDREGRREEAITLEMTNHGSQWWYVETACIAPRWLQSLVGNAVFPDSFWRAVQVSVDSDAGITDLVVRQISELTQVKRVWIYDLESKPARLAALRPLRRIKTLVLVAGKGSTIRDEDVAELSQLPQLRRLVVTRLNEVSPDVIARIAAALPDCRIVDYADEW
jgi:hypothetical protein